MGSPGAITKDGLPGGFASSAEGGMLSVIGPGGTPGALLCGGGPPVLTGAATGAAGLGTGAGCGCAQAAARAPTAITLSQVRVTFASLPVERPWIFIEYLSRRKTAKSRDVSFDVTLCALTFTANVGTLFCTAHQ